MADSRSHFNLNNGFIFNIMGHKYPTRQRHGDLLDWLYNGNRTDFYINSKHIKIIQAIKIASVEVIKPRPNDFN